MPTPRRDHSKNPNKRATSLAVNNNSKAARFNGLTNNLKAISLNDLTHKLNDITNKLSSINSKSAALSLLAKNKSNDLNNLKKSKQDIKTQITTLRSESATEVKDLKAGVATLLLKKHAVVSKKTRTEDVIKHPLTKQEKFTIKNKLNTLLKKDKELFQIDRCAHIFNKNTPKQEQIRPYFNDYQKGQTPKVIPSFTELLNTQYNEDDKTAINALVLTTITNILSNRRIFESEIDDNTFLTNLIHGNIIHSQKELNSSENNPKKHAPRQKPYPWLDQNTETESDDTTQYSEETPSQLQDIHTETEMEILEKITVATTGETTKNPLINPHKTDTTSSVNSQPFSLENIDVVKRSPIFIPDDQNHLGYSSSDGSVDSRPTSPQGNNDSYNYEDNVEVVKVIKPTNKNLVDQKDKPFKNRRLPVSPVSIDTTKSDKHNLLTNADKKVLNKLFLNTGIYEAIFTDSSKQLDVDSPSLIEQINKNLQGLKGNKEYNKKDSWFTTQKIIRALHNLKSEVKNENGENNTAIDFAHNIADSIVTSEIDNNYYDKTNNAKYLDKDLVEDLSTSPKIRLEMKEGSIALRLDGGGGQKHFGGK